MRGCKADRQQPIDGEEMLTLARSGKAKEETDRVKIPESRSSVPVVPT